MCAGILFHQNSGRLKGHDVHFLEIDGQLLQKSGEGEKRAQEPFQKCTPRASFNQWVYRKAGKSQILMNQVSVFAIVWLCRFGKGKEEFAKLPKWKRDNEKKDCSMEGYNGG